MVMKDLGSGEGSDRNKSHKIIYVENTRKSREFWWKEQRVEDCFLRCVQVMEACGRKSQEGTRYVENIGQVVMEGKRKSEEEGGV